MGALVTLITTLSGLVFVWLVVWLSCFTGSSYTYISFKKFLQYYEIDPDKWCLRNNYVYIRSGNCSNLDFMFGPIGIIRYKLWRHKTKKQDLDKKLEEIFGGKNEQ